MKIVYGTDLIVSLLIFFHLWVPQIMRILLAFSSKKKILWCKRIAQNWNAQLHISPKCVYFWFCSSNSSNLSVSKDSANWQAFEMSEVVSVSIKNPFELSLSDWMWNSNLKSIDTWRYFYSSTAYRMCYSIYFPCTLKEICLTNLEDRLHKAIPTTLKPFSKVQAWELLEANWKKERCIGW